MGNFYHSDLGGEVDGDEGDVVEGDLQHGHHLANHGETSSAQVLASCYLLFIFLMSWWLFTNGHDQKRKVPNTNTAMMMMRMTYDDENDVDRDDD